jgi:hypothetical protein
LEPLAWGGLVTSTWDPAGAGVLRLPSGRLVRGRSLRRALPPGPAPGFAVCLLSRQPPVVAWEARWVACVAVIDDLGRPTRGQEMAAFTSSMTFFSAIGLHFFSAYATGQMSPSSRFAASWKPRVE